MTRLCFFLGLIALVVIPRPVHGLEYGGFGGRPAYPDPAVPTSRNWFLYSLPAGQSKEDAVVMSNASKVPITALLYPADSTHSSDGGFSLKQLSEPMTGLGSWVRLFPDPRPDFAKRVDSSILDWCGPAFDGAGPAATELKDADRTVLASWCVGKPTTEIVIPPAAEVNVPFTITIPTSASPGEYTGGLMIQNQLPKPDPSQTGIQLTTRVGVRIYETVPGSVIRDLQISAFSITPAKQFGWYTITLGVKNLSSVSIDHQSRIAVRNRLTGKTQIIERPGQALHDDELIINFPLRRPYIGWWDLQAAVRYEGTTGPVTLSSARLQAMVVDPSFWIILAAVVLLGVGGLLWRRRRRNIPLQIYTVTAGDDLSSIARRYKTSWKRIASLNRLAAPYDLSRGQRLKIPTRSTVTSAKKKRP